MTESTEIQRTPPNQPVVLFDADCSLCTRLARFFTPTLARRGFLTQPLQSPWVAPTLGLLPGELLAEMRVWYSDGRPLGGADAVAHIARRIWWLLPLWLFSLLPGARRLLHFAYRWVARNRHQLGCSLDSPSVSCDVPNSRPGGPTQ